ncbi:ABC transporter permease [Pseudonocardia sp. HH130630-07]|uniref:ABC transporter permease n=1 Tax=Pseudonocardia sp. HH130630-07 TaxID=1690815 RepID=UPI000814C3AE|nr:ABC transporter permease [Pseudonocardia sp. HH130630-07]ANY09317.1 hypothetical protein AFB00_27170 [Pseudonocardia sp. HH130630-07]
MSRAVGSRRLPAILLAGLVLLLVLGLTSGVVALLGQDASLRISDDAFADPSAAHWLGTDNLGRDRFARLCIATGSMLVSSASAALVAAVIGSVLGIVAGYAGGVVDAVIMRLVDLLLAIPSILTALMAGVTLGEDRAAVVFAMAVILSPGFARVMRSSTLSLRSRDFVVAAEISGVSRARIAATHILPNSTTPLLAQFASVASVVVLLESVLNFLGLGVTQPHPAAGLMISESRRFLQTEPFMLVEPAIAILLVAAMWNLLADGLHARMSPKTVLGVPGGRSRHVVLGARVGEGNR